MAKFDDYKIKQSDIDAVHVGAAPDILTGTAAQNKSIFDGYADMISEKFNEFVEFLGQQDTSEIDQSVIEKYRQWGCPI